MSQPNPDPAYRDSVGVAIAKGDRVIVRRRLRGTPGHLTDVIGHVVAFNPLTVRPQEVGGIPSTVTAVEIPEDLIAVVKRLSPRRIRNSEIRAVETASALAFPGTEHRWTEDWQWLMRAGDGITERSNSATPLGRAAGFSPLPLGEIQDFYRRHGLPPQVLAPDRIGNSAGALGRAGSGWERGPEIIVMTKDLAAGDVDTPPLPEGVRFSVDAEPDADWLARYHFRGQPLPRRALALLQERIEGELGFARLTDDRGQTLAITRATITRSEDGDRWLGFSAVEVDPAYRRRGLGLALAGQVEAWGGADHAYLQVIESNTAGRALYARAGFLEHHRQRTFRQR